MTHRWDYENPSSVWERWPWWVRWPAAVLFTLYFGGALIIPFILHHRGILF